MLIVAGIMTIDPDDVIKLKAALSDMVAATLAETGCHQYMFAESLIEPGTVQIFEMWQSPEELQAHFETPHMATFRATLSELSVQRSELYQYEVANIAKL